MALYNFQERFAEYVMDGTKPGTIRAFRKVAPKVGELAHLYTGLRTRHCKKLVDPSPEIRAVHVIMVKENGDVSIWKNCAGREDIAGRMSMPVAEAHKNTLAWIDGFRAKHMHLCFSEMMEYWRGTHALPFVGNYIIWGDVPEWLK